MKESSKYSYKININSLLLVRIKYYHVAIKQGIIIRKPSKRINLEYTNIIHRKPI
jgi:hypothetical protein